MDDAGPLICAHIKETDTSVVMRQFERMILK